MLRSVGLFCQELPDFARLSPRDGGGGNDRAVPPPKQKMWQSLDEQEGVDEVVKVVPETCSKRGNPLNPALKAERARRVAKAGSKIPEERAEGTKDKAGEKTQEKRIEKIKVGVTRDLRAREPRVANEIRPLADFHSTWRAVPRGCPT